MPSSLWHKNFQIRQVVSQVEKVVKSYEACLAFQRGVCGLEGLRCFDPKITMPIRVIFRLTLVRDLFKMIYMELMESYGVCFCLDGHGNDCHVV